MLGNIIRPKYNILSSQEYSVIHIRGTDKTQSQVLDLYKPLIYGALSYELPIKIVTDDQQLSLYISKHFGVKYNPIEAGIFLLAAVAHN